jgi:hypothetical protein
MMAAGKFAGYYPHHEGDIQFPVGVPDVVDESAVYYPHHERIVRIVAKRLHDAECHFRMRLAICYPY